MKVTNTVVAMSAIAFAFAAPAAFADPAAPADGATAAATATTPAADATVTADAAAPAAAAPAVALVTVKPTDVPNEAEVIGEGDVVLGKVAKLYVTSGGTLSSVVVASADGAVSKKMDADGFRLSGGKLFSAHTQATFNMLPNGQ